MKRIGKWCGIALLGLSSLVAEVGLQAAESGFKPGQRIVFLGDSITAAGDFIAIVDAQLRVSHGRDTPYLINLGLPSETCSGLSEPEHPFPRPNVHERLSRALERSRPDVVVACYGMNDAIYYPFASERFHAYQAGMRRLQEAVAAYGAELVILTPPAFDPLPFRKRGKLLPRNAPKYSWMAIYEHYDDVIAVYAAWVKTLQDSGALVVNIHDPIRDHLAQKRATDPEFALSTDGVHIDRNGHALIAKALLAAWGEEWREDIPNKLVDATQERLKVLHAAWLTHVGHLRPGGKAGLPLADANAKAGVLERALEAQLR